MWAASFAWWASAVASCRVLGGDPGAGAHSASKPSALALSSADRSCGKRASPPAVKENIKLKISRQDMFVRQNRRAPDTPVPANCTESRSGPYGTSPIAKKMKSTIKITNISNSS